MKGLSALFAMAMAMSANAAGAELLTAAWTSPVCSAGPSSGRPAGLDADGDGVADSEDWCPRSAPGDRVGSNGCASWEVPVQCDRVVAAPAPAPVPVRVVPVAEVPAEAPAEIPAPAMPVGEPDSDHDGVPDADDKCPGTPRGVEVDAHGCANISRLVLKGVNFGSGSAKLLPAANGTLRSVASAMKASPKLEVEVDGYTDSVGTAAKNLALSERRARSVKQFLVKEGVAAGRLTTQGYGQANPADTNDTPAGRANNRRVAFKITAS